MEEKIKKGRTKSQDTYDKENIETVSFKARKGSRNNIKNAAIKTGQSVNGFIRVSLNDAVKKIIGIPMEPEKTIKNDSTPIPPIE